MARTSHLKVRRLIEEEVKSMSDREFFRSRSYAAYLTDMAEILVKRYGLKKCMVRIVDERGSIAYTDDQKITINYHSEMVQGKSTRKGKHEMIIGLMLHEVGHMLYTNFKLMKQCDFEVKSIGSLELLAEEEELETEFVTYFSKFKGTNLLSVLQYKYHFFMNALEDAHVNRRVAKRFPGISKSLEMAVDEIIMNAPTFEERLKAEHSKVDTIIGMIHLYAISSDFFYEEWELGDERVQFLLDVLDLIDESVYTYRSSDRIRIQNTIFAKLLPFLKQEFEEYEVLSSGEIDDMFPEDEDYRGSSPDAEADEEVSELGERYKALREGSGESDEDEPDEDESDEDSDSDIVQEKEETSKELRDELRRSVCEDNPFKADPEAKASSESDDEEKSEKELEKILKDMIDKKVETEEESLFTDSLNDFAGELKHAEVHDGVRCEVMRMKEVTPHLINLYNAVASEATSYGKQTAKHFQKIVMKRKKGFKMDGLYAGRHFEARSYSHGDGKYFSRKIAPTNHPNLAVMVLVDESGSTSGDRIAYERLAALVIHDFCRRLDIPISVYGHYETFWDGTVILTAYADADKPDEKDKYRIMGISDHDNNRDGYALKFCAEKLLRSDADFKLLISISDGQPCASGYTGVIGCEDVAGVIKEYKRKGITPIAAAIGDDKEAIEHIYRENFLNISDLETLPKRLTDLVKRYVK